MRAQQAGLGTALLPYFSPGGGEWLEECRAANLLVVLLPALGIHKLLTFLALLLKFYLFDFFPGPCNTCSQPSRVELSWDRNGCSSLWSVEWSWPSGTLESVPVMLPLQLLTCQGWYFFAVGSANECLFLPLFPWFRPTFQFSPSEMKLTDPVTAAEEVVGRERSASVLLIPGKFCLF